MSYPASYLQLEVSGTAPAQAKSEDWESGGREEGLIPDTEDRGVFLISTD